MTTGSGQVYNGELRTNCVNHAIRLNEMTESCSNSSYIGTGIQCSEYVETGITHQMLKLANYADCVPSKNMLNVVIVDVVPGADASLTALQCSGTGYLKASGANGAGNVASCSAIVNVLNTALNLHQSGDYRGCDHTTATTSVSSTATTSASTTATTDPVSSTVTTSVTTSATTSVTSTEFGKLECHIVDGTIYIRATDCQDQADLLNTILKTCSSSHINSPVRCTEVGGYDVFTVDVSSDSTACTLVATTLNNISKSDQLPGHIRRTPRRARLAVT